MQEARYPNKLKMLLRREGISQRQAWLDCDQAIAWGTFRNYLDGISNIPREHRAMLARVIGCEVADLAPIDEIKKIESNRMDKRQSGPLEPYVPHFEEWDGRFSFGRKKTTGMVLDGDGMSMYLPQHIRSHYIPIAAQLPEELQARRDAFQQEQEQKRTQGLPFFWNGNIYSIDRFVIGREPANEEMTLDIWFRPSDYYTFQATNMSLDDQDLRQRYLGENVDWYETVPHFSHSFGTSLVVVTSDGYALLTQRSSRQGSNAGYYSISANEGLSRPLDRGIDSEAPDVYRCAIRGMSEELGLHAPDDFSPDDILFLTFEVDTQYALWGVLGMARIRRTVEELRDIRQSRVKDKIENQQIIPVPFTPEDICSFVFSQEHWTPGGLICLYHSLVHEFGYERVDRAIAAH